MLNTKKIFQVTLKKYSKATNHAGRSNLKIRNKMLKQRLLEIKCWNSIAMIVKKNLCFVDVFFLLKWKKQIKQAIKQHNAKDIIRMGVSASTQR